MQSHGVVFCRQERQASQHIHRMSSRESTASRLIYHEASPLSHLAKVPEGVVKILHALRQECEKSIVWTASHQRSLLLRSSLESRAVAALLDCPSEALRNAYVESFALLIPAQYVVGMTTARDRFFSRRYYKSPGKLHRHWW